jgi:DNA helicase INO80
LINTKKYLKLILIIKLSFFQSYWKRFDRVERQQKRQQEKEAEEQQKQDLQLLEAKRQQRKLNFLITQTELYAHFIANKIGAKGLGEESEASILNKLDETPVNGRLAEIDDYDCEDAKAMARNNAAQVNISSFIFDAEISEKICPF